MALPAIGLIGIIAAWAARFLTAGVIKWLAWKAAVLFVTCVLIPIVLNNIFYKMLEKAMALHTTQAGSMSGQMMALTGLAAWLAIQLKIPESMALVVGALSKRVGMSFIPFIGGRR